MFGYIMMEKDELKVKEYNRYQSFYCGLCESLRKKHGKGGQLVLSYDMTFLAILLSSLYEGPLQKGEKHCLVHGGAKREFFAGEALTYAADMNLLLGYYNAMDDWLDEKHMQSRAILHANRKKVTQIEEQYPRQAKAVKRYMRRLLTAQKENTMQPATGRDVNETRTETIDRMASLTGDMLGEIFVWKPDTWEPALRQLGFYLGRFVYLLDAYTDLAEDEKNGQFNVWMPYRNDIDFEPFVKRVLLMSAEGAARALEYLPLVKDVGILRNVVYAGIFTRQKRK